MLSILEFDLLSHWSVKPLTGFSVLITVLMLILSVVALVFIVIKVIKRHRRSSKVKLLAVIGGNIALFITLSLLVLPIVKKDNNSQQSLVVTATQDSVVLDNAIKRFRASKRQYFYILDDGKGQLSFVYDFIKAQGLKDKVMIIQSLSQLSKADQVIKLEVYGDGLMENQWQGSEYFDIQFIPSKPLVGLVEPKWSDNLTLGESAWFSAKLQSADQTMIYQVELLDINSDKVASVKVKANEEFKLDFLPKGLGRLSYKIVIKTLNQEDFLVQEFINLVVNDGDKIKVLIKTASPSFEVRHLKNWLSEQGSQLSVISQTSKYTSVSQNINSQKTSNIKNDHQYFSSIALAGFNWLVIDGRSILQLTEPQQLALLEAINKGLAVYVIADETLANAVEHSNKVLTRLLSYLTLSTKINEQAKQTKALMTGVGKLPAFTPVNLSFKIKQSRLLVTDQANEPIVASHQYGLGNITVSLINTSYQWKLSGLSVVYGQYWQTLIKELVNITHQNDWQEEKFVRPNFIYQHRTSCFASNDVDDKANEVLLIASVTDKEPLTLSPMNNIAKQGEYCVNWFSDQLGWLDLELLSKNEQSINRSVTSTHFIYSFTDWQAWQQLLKRRASLKVAQENMAANNNQAIENINVITSESPINKTILWLLFIGLISLLWIEHKWFAE